MSDYNPQAIFEAIKKTHLKFTDLARKINKHYKKPALSEKITPVQIGALTNGNAMHIYLSQLLGLAGVLDCFGSDFIDEKIKELGTFEVKLLSFESGLKYSEHVSELETQSKARMSIFPTIAVYPYRPIKDKNSALHKVNEERLEKMKLQNVNDYFTIDSLLCFLFNQFGIPLSKDEKIETLKRMLDVFSGNILSNLIFYTNSDYYQRDFPMIELFESQQLVYLNLPLRTSILAIKNKKFCNNIALFLQGAPKPFLMTTKGQSLELLQKSIFHLENYPQPSFWVFFNNLSSNLQHLIKVAFPHLFSPL